MGSRYRQAGPIDQQLSSLQSRSHVGHHELYALEAASGLPNCCLSLM